jgi:hypothetical protein
MNTCTALHARTKRDDWVAPRIKETNDFLIPITLQRSGFTVIIPPVPGAAEGSGFTIALTSNYASVRKQFTIVSPAAELEVRFEPQDLVQDDGFLTLQGPGDLQYIYSSGPGKPDVSDPRLCDWQEIIPTLRIKEHEEASPDSYVLPSETADSGITLELAPWENMAAGDTLNLYVAATAEGAGKWLSYTVQPADLARTLELPYEPQLLKALRPGVMQASYTITQEGKELRSRSIDIELLPLLPAAQPKYQTTDPFGNKVFLTIVESDENGQLFAQVIQKFSLEGPVDGDRLILVVNSAQPHSYFYPLQVQQPSAAATFKIPYLEIQSLRGSAITLSTLWQRSNGEVISSPIEQWIVAQTGFSAKQPRT